MSLIASTFAPAVASIAFALEPPQAPWPASVGPESLPAPAAAHPSFAATARVDGLSLLPKAGDSALSLPARAASPLDDSALSDALRWLLSFAGLAAIGALRNPRY